MTMVLQSIWGFTQLVTVLSLDKTFQFLCCYYTLEILPCNTINQLLTDNSDMLIYNLNPFVKIVDCLIYEFKYELLTWCCSPSSKSLFVSSDKHLRITGATLIPFLGSNGLNR